MKINTKSSITLPAEELELVVRLQAELGAKTKVEVVRRGLRLLQEVTERESLREAYRRASQATRETTVQEVAELDGLVALLVLDVEAVVHVEAVEVFVG